jgi:hypothetical protein
VFNEELSYEKNFATNPYHSNLKNSDKYELSDDFEIPFFFIMNCFYDLSHILSYSYYMNVLYNFFFYFDNFF